MKFVNQLHNAEYPLYGVKFLQEDERGATLVVTGGGGEGKNGIPNKITTLRYCPGAEGKDSVVTLHDVDLRDEDDSPTVLDASLNNDLLLIGCNENSTKVREGNGNNKHIRKYRFDPSKFQLKFEDSIDLFRSSDPDEYTKLLNISRDGTLAAIASSSENPSRITIINTFDLTEKFEIESLHEIKDLNISPNGKVISYITKNSLEFISTITGKSISRLNTWFQQKNYSLSKVKFIDNDSLLLVATLTKGSGVVLINITVKSGEASIMKSKIITKKYRGITSMDLNKINDIVVMSTSENSVIVVKLSDFSIKKTYSQIHTFAITRVTISNEGKYFASVSAANTIQLVKVPENFATSLSSTEQLYQIFIRFIFVVLFALLLQYLLNNKEGIVEEYNKLDLSFLQQLIMKRNNNLMKINQYPDNSNDEFAPQSTLIGNITN